MCAGSVGVVRVIVILTSKSIMGDSGPAGRRQARVAVNTRLQRIDERDEVPMPKTVVDFPVFDADNHMYETTDAFTKFLPKEYDGLYQVRAGQRANRDRGAQRHLSEYILNPTFEVVGRPGASEEFFKHGNPEGKSRRETHRRADTVPRGVLLTRSPPRPHGPARPRPCAHVADAGQPAGKRLHSDPRATHAVVHALNQWMHEHWTFDYEGRIFVRRSSRSPSWTEAIKELEWLAERGAKAHPHPSRSRSGVPGILVFALPEFDPFWQRVTGWTSPSACTHPMTG